MRTPLAALAAWLWFVSIRVRVAGSRTTQSNLHSIRKLFRAVDDYVFARLQAVIPPQDLPKILYWIAMHPDAGDDAAIHRLGALGLPDVGGPTKPIHGRIMIYAFKLLGRLTGRIPPV